MPDTATDITREPFDLVFTDYISIPDASGGLRAICRLDASPMTRDLAESLGLVIVPSGPAVWRRR